MTIEELLDYLDGQGIIITDFEEVEKALLNTGLSLNTPVPYTQE